MYKSQKDQVDHEKANTPTQEGVTVSTWGTSVNAESGIPKYVNDVLYGENVGHVAIMLSLKNNDENLKMVKKYCDKAGIPYSFRTIASKTVKYEQEEYQGPVIDFEEEKNITDNKEYQAYKSQLQSQGKFIVKNEAGQRSVVRKINDDTKPVYQENLIDVYFSWWPGLDKNKGYSLSSDMFADNQEERKGVPVEYSEIAAKMLNPEHRILSGLLNTVSFGMIKSHDITLGPMNIEHAACLPENIADLFKIRDEIDNTLNQHFLTIKLLDTFKHTKEDKHKVSENTILILKSMLGNDLEKYLTEDQAMVRNLSELKETLTSLKDKSYQEFNRSTKAYFYDLGDLNNANTTKYKGYAAVYQKKLQRHESYSDLNGPIRGCFNNCLKKNENKFPMKIGDFIEILFNDFEINNIHVSKDAFNNIFKLEAHDNFERTINKKELVNEYTKGLKDFFDEDVGSFRLENYSKIRDEMERPVLKEYLNLALTTGRPADNSVMIPLSSNQHSGIEPKKLLRAMNEFVSNGEHRFNIANENCSVAVATVMANCSGEIGKKIFNKREYSAIANPQLVHNNTVKYLETLQNPNHSIRLIEDTAYIKARNYIVAETLDGIAKAFYSEDSTIAQRVIAGLQVLATVPALVVVGLKEAVVSSDSSYTTGTESKITPTQQKDTSTSKIMGALGGSVNEKTEQINSLNQRTTEALTEVKEQKVSQGSGNVTVNEAKVERGEEVETNQPPTCK
jgi:hypothetical protein